MAVSAIFYSAMGRKWSFMTVCLRPGADRTAKSLRRLEAPQLDCKRFTLYFERSKAETFLRTSQGLFVFDHRSLRQRQADLNLFS